MSINMSQCTCMAVCTCFYIQGDKHLPKLRHIIILTHTHNCLLYASVYMFSMDHLVMWDCCCSPGLQHLCILSLLHYWHSVNNMYTNICPGGIIRHFSAIWRIYCANDYTHTHTNISKCLPFSSELPETQTPAWQAWSGCAWARLE